MEKCLIVQARYTTLMHSIYGAARNTSVTKDLRPLRNLTQRVDAMCDGCVTDVSKGRTWAEGCRKREERYVERFPTYLFLSQRSSSCSRAKTRWFVIAHAKSRLSTGWLIRTRWLVRNRLISSARRPCDLPTRATFPMNGKHSLSSP